MYIWGGTWLHSIMYILADYIHNIQYIMYNISWQKATSSCWQFTVITISVSWLMTSRATDSSINSPSGDHLVSTNCITAGKSCLEILNWDDPSGATESPYDTSLVILHYIKKNRSYSYLLFPEMVSFAKWPKRLST